jgi:tripartite-type tricarboxylate transporter receptor subunit TctC
MRLHRFGVLGLALGCLICQFAANGWAQSYPVKTVRFVVNQSAGSGSDTIARIAAAGLAQAFGQQVIVDNRSGAAGNIGADIASKAPPDGYTLFLGSQGVAANVSLYRDLPYDLVRDFAPVTQLASSPSVVVVHPSLPVKSIAELVKLAKARPGAINYASTGIGSATWVPGELFKWMAGVNLLQVPYRGGGESLTAVVAGEVSVYFAPIAAALPQVRQGRLRPLAVTSVNRLLLLPEYPTVAEAGYAGYEFGNWYGILVPIKTPKETIAVIHEAAVSALRNPNLSKRLTDLGYIIVGDQPEEFAAHIKSEIALLAKIIQQTGVTVN